MRTFVLVIVSLMSSTVFAAATLNETAIGQCESAFYSCAYLRGIQSWNTSDYNDNPAFVNCSSSFSACLKDQASLSATRPEACYLADAEWTNFRVSAWFSSGIFVFSNILFPMFLKVSAKKITKWGSYDLATHPILGHVGHWLLYATDADGDKKVTANEIVSPQTIFAFTSVAVPIYQWFSANTQQAKCDYQNSLPAATAGL